MRTALRFISVRQIRLYKGSVMPPGMLRVSSTSQGSSVTLYCDMRQEFGDERALRMANSKLGLR